MTYRDRFDCTPQQYHAGVDKLWSVLNVSGPQDDDVYTLTVKEITKLREEITRLRKQYVIGSDLTR